MKREFPKFKAGIYQHYKGPFYLVLGLAHDANDEKRMAIIYIGLELNRAHTGPRLAVRTYEDFYSWVDPKNGEQVNKNHPGAKLRFTYIGDTMEELKKP
jgi:hypothetical protein